jgi:hypothetical protein
MNALQLQLELHPIVVVTDVPAREVSSSTLNQEFATV